MPTTHLTIPAPDDLKTPAGWTQLTRDRFLAVRFHLALVQTPAEDTTYPGEIIGTYHTTNRLEISEEIQQEFAVTSVEETVAAQVVSEELLAQVGAEIRAGIELPGFTLGSGVTSRVEQKLAQSLATTTRQTTSVTISDKYTFRVTQTIANPGTETYHAVTCYRPMRCAVTLHYLDYLVVELHRGVFGLRQRKTSYPRPRSDQHPNRLLLNRPLFTLRYWQLLPKSSNIYTETQYRQLDIVRQPDAITIEPLDVPSRMLLPRKVEQPTLYTLANAAFPRGE